MAKKKTKREVKLTGIDLDRIAAEAGFPVFVTRLNGHGNYVMYTNEDRTLNRLYNPVDGSIVITYPPKIRTVSERFHNPEQMLPADKPFIRINQYTGRGSKPGS